MSIRSEINRISQNVTDALTAIGTRGVTVPTGSTSDDLPALISQISATVSSGQIAATAGQILTGYSAWVNGAEVKGSLRAMTTAEILAAVQAGWAS